MADYSQNEDQDSNDTQQNETSVQDSEQATNQNPEGIYDTLPQEADATQPAQEDSTNAVQSQGAATSSSPDATQIPDANQAPQETQQQQATPTLQITPTTQAEYMQHANQTSADLANGHIQPETYSDLFAHKSTLGKIGTLFGLMLSGAGSGLAHQPNMLMDMMNKEIDRDLDAQKSSALNAQNILRINQQDALNKTNIALNQALTVSAQKNAGLISAQTVTAQKQPALVQAQTQQAQAGTQANLADVKYKMAQAGLTAAQIKNWDAQTALSVQTKSQIDMQRIAFADLINKKNKLPVGSPERLAAEQQIAVMAPLVQGKEFDLGSRADALGTMINNTLNPQQEEGNAQNGPVNQGKMNDLINKGRVLPATTPGVIPPSEVQPVKAEQAKAVVNRNAAQAYNSAVQNMLSVKDKLTPNLRNAYIAAYHKAATGSAIPPSADEMKQYDPIFPSGTDYLVPKVWKQKYNNQMAQFKNNEQTLTYLKGYGLLNPFPNYGIKQPASQQITNQPQTKTVNGITYKRGPTGEAIPIPSTAAQ
jgi:hypothetical protein